MEWDNFLVEIADKHELSGAARKWFLMRFSEDNLNKDDKQFEIVLAELDMQDPLKTYRKQMGGVYKALATSLPEIADKTRNKADKIRCWLKQCYEDGNTAAAQSVTVLGTEPPNWREVCCKMLEKQLEDRRLRRQATECGFEIHVNVGLGLVERRQQQRRDAADPSHLYDLTDQRAKGKTYDHDAFLAEVIGRPPVGQSKHLAIVGEPGAGKTTLLTAIAQHLVSSDAPAVPIFIPLARLQGKPLKDYILQEWLTEAVRLVNPVAEVPVLYSAFQQWLLQEPVWLLLDAVDEMGVASPAQALHHIQGQLTDWLGQVRVALTCRLNVWDASTVHSLSGRFTTYKTQEFTPDQVRQFIKQWFGQAREAQRGKDLRRKLADPQRDRIRELVRNPLRLSLLCQIFKHDTNAELPQTKAGLYEQLVDFFYKWKEENHPTTATQRCQLNEALGKLALAGLNHENGLQQFRLPEKSARIVMGDEWFNLADQLGWLNRIDCDLETGESVYAFYHATFQEYFAALAIDDWHYFLNHVPQNLTTGSYRIFEAQWNEIILLWMGSNKISNNHKNEFIQSLVIFGNNCDDFYYFKSYILAAFFVAEFKDCIFFDDANKKVIEFTFGFFDEDVEKWKEFLYPISSEAKKALVRLDREKVISEIIQLLKIHEVSRIFDPQANMGFSDLPYILGNIALDEDTIIDCLIEIFQETNDLVVLKNIISILGRITRFTPRRFLVIEVLSNAIKHTKIPSLLRDLIYALEEIEPGNKEVISGWIKLLRMDEKWNQYNFGDIDFDGKLIGNEYVVLELINTIQKTEDKEIIRRAMRSLTRISLGEKPAVSYLEDLFNSSTDQELVNLAGFVLIKLDPFNERVFQHFLLTLEESNDHEYLWRIADGLGEIASENPVLAYRLVEVIRKNNFNFRNLGWFIYPLRDLIGEEIIESILIEILEKYHNEDICCQIAVYLSQYLCYNSSLSFKDSMINALLKVLEYSENEYTVESICEVFSKIAIDDQRVIAKLNQLLDNFQHTNLYACIAGVLGKVDSDNSNPAEILVKLLNKNQIFTEEDIDGNSDYWGLAHSLAQIPYGNDQETARIIQALENIDFVPDDLFDLADSGLLPRLDPFGRWSIPKLIGLLEAGYVSEQIIRDLDGLLGDEIAPSIMIPLLRNQISDQSDSNHHDFEICFAALYEYTSTISYVRFRQEWDSQLFTHPDVSDEAVAGETSSVRSFSKQLFSDLLNQLQASDRIHPLPIKLQVSGEQTESAIAKRLWNRIFAKALPDEVPPKVEDVGDLERALVELRMRLGAQQLAIVFYDTEPHPALIQVCQQITDMVQIGWITDQAIACATMRTFHPDSSDLLTAIQTWLDEMM